MNTDLPTAKILKSLLREADVKAQEFKTIKKQRKRIKEEVSAATEAVEINAKAIQVVQMVAAEVQTVAHKHISDIVTSCLASIWDDPYEFRITFNERRGKTEAELEFIRNGEVVSPMDEAGGGCVDVAAFALRLANLILRTDGKPRKLIILDEPFRFVSPNLRDRVRQMVDQVSKDLDVQFIMVTNL